MLSTFDLIRVWPGNTDGRKLVVNQLYEPTTIKHRFLHKNGPNLSVVFCDQPRGLPTQKAILFEWVSYLWNVWLAKEATTSKGPGVFCQSGRGSYTNRGVSNGIHFVK